MRNIKISILVPVYNAGVRFERCLRSLFEQTYENIEIVFVDDCSTDDSMEILVSIMQIYSFISEKVKIVHHEANLGVATARNTLLKNAAGDYIMWVDADDYIDRTAAAVLAENVKSTNADIVCYGAMRHFKNKAYPYMWKDETTSKDFIYDILERRTHSALWGRLFRRSLFEQNGISFVDGINIGEDLFVLLKAVYFANVVVSCNDVLYHQDFTNANSLTKKVSADDLINEIELYDKIETFFAGKMDVELQMSRKKLNVYLLQIYRACLANCQDDFIAIGNKVKELGVVKRPTVSKTYLVFLNCHNYYICCIWARVIFLLKYFRPTLKW